MAKSAEETFAVAAFGWAARNESGVLSPFQFTRRTTGEDDVRIKIKYCGICHTDFCRSRNQWADSKYPMVPGHEIVGEVTEVGNKVQNFKVGDTVGVGCMVGSCLQCNQCLHNLENYCSQRILTYNGTYYDGTTTYGGYSDHIVVKEHFVVQIPDNLPLDAAAPLLCAGITTYSAMKYYGLDKPDLHLGVVGLGGHGHLAVKFAKAFGATVTAISTSPDKMKDAIDRLGADSVLDSRDGDQMAAAAGTMDAVIDAVPVVHPLQPLISLLNLNGKMVILGATVDPLELPVMPLLGGRKMVGGTSIGGLKETREVLDFAAENNITAEIEVISMEDVNEAMDRLEKGDVMYRFVIDVANSLKAA